MLGRIFGGFGKSTSAATRASACSSANSCAPRGRRGRGLFGSGGIFAACLGKNSAEQEVSPAGTTTSVSSSGWEEHLVIFARGETAAQRCFRLIRMFGEQKGAQRLSGWVQMGGWSVDALRTLLGEDQSLQDCMSQLEDECRTSFGTMAPLVFDASLSTAGRYEPSPHADHGTTLRALAEDLANASSRFVTEFELLRRCTNTGQSDEVPTPGKTVGIGDEEDEGDEFRAAGPGFSAKLLLAFLDLANTIERGLGELLRRAEWLDDVPLQIIVTGGEDLLLKHSTTVFLWQIAANSCITCADVKELLRKNVRELRDAERREMDAEEQRLSGALGKEFWAEVGAGDAEALFQQKLADGFDNVIFEEPVSTLECGRGHLVLAVGWAPIAVPFPTSTRRRRPFDRDGRRGHVDVGNGRRRHVDAWSFVPSPTLSFPVSPDTISDVSSHTISDTYVSFVTACM